MKWLPTESKMSDAGSHPTEQLHTVLIGDGSISRINEETYGFTEGPCNDSRGNIYFIDYKNNWILRYKLGSRQIEIWARDTQGSNGGVFRRDGQLLSCRGHALDVVAWKSDGTVDRVLASAFEGRPFNGPNDLIVNRSGWIYFTDPNFDGHDHQPESVYSVSPSGAIARIDDRIARPNGILLTPDEKMLIVNGTAQRELIAYDVRPDGGVQNRRLWATVRDPNRQAYPGYPPERWFGCDGMAIDEQGRLFVTCGAGVEVFDPTGKTIGAIEIPEKPTNACFGGPGNRTLFVTAQSSVYQVQCKIPGIVFQQDAA